MEVTPLIYLVCLGDPTHVFSAYVLLYGFVRRVRLWFLNLKAEVYVLHRLVDRARTQDVDFCGRPSAAYSYANTIPKRTGYRSVLQIRLCDVTATLELELALAGPLLFQSPSYAHKLGTFDIVKHDDVSSCIDGFVGFLL